MFVQIGCRYTTLTLIVASEWITKWYMKAIIIYSWGVTAILVLVQLWSVNIQLWRSGWMMVSFITSQNVCHQKVPLSVRCMLSYDEQRNEKVMSEGALQVRYFKNGRLNVYDEVAGFMVPNRLFEKMYRIICGNQRFIIRFL